MFFWTIFIWLLQKSYFWFYFYLIFLCQKGFRVDSGGWTTVDLNRLERTNGNFVGISWEFRGKNLELLVLMLKELQFYLGTSWE